MTGFPCSSCSRNVPDFDEPCPSCGHYTPPPARDEPIAVDRQQKARAAQVRELLAALRRHKAISPEVLKRSNDQARACAESSRTDAGGGDYEQGERANRERHKETK